MRKVGTIFNPCCQRPASCHVEGQHWSAAPILRSFGTGIIIIIITSLFGLTWSLRCKLRHICAHHSCCRTGVQCAVRPSAHCCRDDTDWHFPIAAACCLTELRPFRNHPLTELWLLIIIIIIILRQFLMRHNTTKVITLLLLFFVVISIGICIVIGIHIRTGIDKCSIGFTGTIILCRSRSVAATFGTYHFG